MKAIYYFIYYFISNALPWIAIGLFVAVTAMVGNAKKEGIELTGFAKALPWIPVACFALVAILQFAEGKTGSATTWMVIGIANVGLNYANNRKDE